MKSPVSQILKTLHERYASLQEGAVADYIPELSKVDPGLFGICIATQDGFVYEVGDSRQPFTIQSISKPFVYGMALEDNTRAEVLAKVGVEPTGAFLHAIRRAASRSEFFHHCTTHLSHSHPMPLTPFPLPLKPCDVLAQDP